MKGAKYTPPDPVQEAPKEAPVQEKPAKASKAPKAAPQPKE